VRVGVEEGRQSGADHTARGIERRQDADDHLNRHERKGREDEYRNGVRKAVGRALNAEGRERMWLRPKNLLFGVIGVMFVYVLTHSERFLIDPADREWMHIQTFKWWLLPHAIAGACAMILGPMQFSDRLRQ